MLLWSLPYFPDTSIDMPRNPSAYFRFLLAGGALGASYAFAHTGEPHGIAEGSAWDFDPWIIGMMVLTSILYAGGARRLWSNAGLGAGVPVWRTACFTVGMLTLALALFSPIDTLGSELFSMHMVQHELLMLVVAPLLIAGQPLAVFLWAFKSSARQRIARLSKAKALQVPWQFLTKPLSAWMLHALILWVWHFPSLFQASLTDNLMHAAQHASFLGSALLFWASLIGPQSRLRSGTAVLYILTTVIHTGMLGALLTFSHKIWYPIYAGRTEAWGLSVLEDQQLGGLIMWVPAGFILLFVGLLVAAKAIAPDKLVGRDNTVGAGR